MSSRSWLLALLVFGCVPFAAAETTAPRVEGFTPAATDWPWWRGPSNNGIAVADQDPPVTWSETENVIWKTPIPGRGHSCATVVGDRVFLTTADEEKELLAVVCLSRKTGELLWRSDVHQGGMEKKGHKKSSQASSTVACDGQQVYFNFLHQGNMVTTALDLEGKQVWQTKVVGFATHQGFGSSPALFGSLVYVTADSKTGGVLAALSRERGEIIWQAHRPEKPNYASPIVLHVAGKDQLLVSGCDLASGFHPKTGEKFWEIEGATTECVTTMVTDGSRVFVSGGYPRKHVQAIEADGSGKTAWENNVQVYVPSMIVKDGYLYAIQDGGVASCWKSSDGEEKWKERVGGTFSASLTLVGDKLYGINEAGTSFVFRANPEKFEKLAENKLPGEAFATPTICGGQIFLRIAEHKEGKRQEMVYCLGKKN
ncbi:outer membrane protein assembly factor BamB family protein [Anatilimnocola floriformis]|uniref:outer membrane protein assembly factor BamB family protein n=1 Tax=Anatilimnocola floriformis TaxID=2948575 RepID=UPI0020C35382|nr:PQQ-binding-like beta-propeller repeat protein [Anatilimnocola floriformis]